MKIYTISEHDELIEKTDSDGNLIIGIKLSWMEKFVEIARGKDIIKTWDVAIKLIDDGAKISFEN